MGSLVLLVSVGLFLAACGSDGDDEVDNGQTTRVIDDAGYLVNPEDFVSKVEGTGIVYYSADERSWYILADERDVNRTDGGTFYFSYSLPTDLQQRQMKVKFSGDIYKYHHRESADGTVTFLAGFDYYYILFKDIHRVN